MIDKLRLKAFETKTHDEIRSDLKELKYITTKSSRYYSEILVFEQATGISVEISVNPNIEGISSLVMMFNPSRFPSFGKVDSIVNSVFNSDPIIDRIDFNVDIAMPINDVLGSLMIKRKRAREVYREYTEATGVYIGRNPDLYCLYNKALKDKLSGDLTRIERRLFKQKVPFRNYSELDFYLDFNPFESLSMYELKMTGNRLSDEAKFKKLQELALLHGLTGAKRILNSNQNFNRDYGKFLLERCDGLSLYEIHRTEMINFFNGVKDDGK